MRDLRLPIARPQCYNPPHDWEEQDPGWMVCMKCGLHTSVEVFAANREAFD